MGRALVEVCPPLDPPGGPFPKMAISLNDWWH